MVALLTTLVVLGLALVWLRAWLRQSRFAQGIALGASSAIARRNAGRGARRGMPHMPIWVPPLPFALIATSLFGFGVLAWIWADD